MLKYITANLLTLTVLKRNFSSLVTDTNLLEYTTLLLIPLTLFAILALSLMNISLSLAKSLHWPNLITHIRQLQCICLYFDLTTASTTANSTVHTKLDHCNSLCFNLPKVTDKSLQLCQKSFARAVVKAPKSCHVSPVFCAVH